MRTPEEWQQKLLECESMSDKELFLIQLIQADAIKHGVIEGVKKSAEEVVNHKLYGKDQTAMGFSNTILTLATKIESGEVSCD